MQLWSYEFLGMFVSKNEYSDPMVIPRGLKWMRDSKGKKDGARDLVAYRAFLDQLQADQVTPVLFGSFVLSFHFLLLGLEWMLWLNVGKMGCLGRD